MQTKYHELLDRLTPFIVTKNNLQIQLQQEFLGQKMTHQFDPLDQEHKDFFERLLILDRFAFGPGNMSMPKWVLFDCAFMPGAVIGFGINSRELSLNDRKLLGIESNVFMPLSMYISIPVGRGEAWFGHNLSSLNQKIELPLNGLGLLTKYFALGVLGFPNLIGATQWSSPALDLHLKLSPIKLLSTKVPLHTHQDTLCYQSENLYSKEDIFQSGKEHLVFNLELANSTESIELIQDKINQSQDIYLVEKTDKVFRLFL